MRTVLLVLLCLYFVNAATIWHLTDVHIDPYYNYPAIQPFECSNDFTKGVFGSHDCDTAPALFENVLEFMTSVQPNPELVVLTGDNYPHFNVPRDQNQVQKVIGLTVNVTNRVAAQFPTAHIIPVIGNHDTCTPQGQLYRMYEGPYMIYEQLWSQSFSALFEHHPEYEEISRTFHAGGYYTVYYDDIKLRVIVINTMLYYAHNNVTFTNPDDPAGQLLWLKSVITKAAAANQKSLIVYHGSPGVGEWNGKFEVVPLFGDQLVTILSSPDAAKIAPIHLGGHFHTDYPRVLPGDVAVSLSAPALVSRAYNGSTNNAAVRLFHMEDGELLSYDQYYTDIDYDNTVGEAVWHLEYDSASFFGIDKLSPSLLAGSLRRCMTDPVCFDKFLLYNTAMFRVDECYAREDCKKLHKCGVFSMTPSSLFKCMLRK